MSNIHTLFPMNVSLEPVAHKYYDSQGKEYISVSKFLSMLSERFEDTPAFKRATSETKLIWKAKGKAAADHGTNIHEALELYNKTGQILQSNSHLADAIRSVTDEYKDYNKTYDEICLYSNEYRIAGTTDKICALSNRKDSEVDLADFKTNISKGIYFHSDYKKRLFAPLDHLQDCNYVKYSLQLSVYAYFFEQLTGRRVRKLFIHFIPPNDMMKHQKIPVIYMKNDVQTILEKYKNEILYSLDGAPQIEINNQEEEF